MEEEERKIYKRQYDNPMTESGVEKPNKFLGTFKVEQQLEEDMYSEKFIGTCIEDGKKYLVEGTEVSGYYNPGLGGIRYSIIEINV